MTEGERHELHRELAVKQAAAAEVRAVIDRASDQVEDQATQQRSCEGALDDLKADAKRKV